MFGQLCTSIFVTTVWRRAAYRRDGQVSIFQMVKIIITFSLSQKLKFNCFYCALSIVPVPYVSVLLVCVVGWECSKGIIQHAEQNELNGTNAR